MNVRLVVPGMLFSLLWCNAGLSAAAGSGMVSFKEPIDPMNQAFAEFQKECVGGAVCGAMVSPFVIACLAYEPRSLMAPLAGGVAVTKGLQNNFDYLANRLYANHRGTGEDILALAGVDGNDPETKEQFCIAYESLRKKMSTIFCTEHGIGCYRSTCSALENVESRCDDLLAQLSKASVRTNMTRELHNVLYDKVQSAGAKFNFVTGFGAGVILSSLVGSLIFLVPDPCTQCASACANVHQPGVYR